MKVTFWLCFAIVTYAYVGYALLLSAYARFYRRPLLYGSARPTVSVVIAARNEAARLPGKLANLKDLDYPSDLLQIVIASDGSTDDTPRFLEGQAKWIVPVILEKSQGKAAALNAAVRRATGDVLLFLDVRQVVDRDALSELVACFEDPNVGAVSGELLLENAAGQGGDNALGVYWRIEKMVRKLEAATGSVVGVTGAIYAMRRELYVEIPTSTILDDVFVPMEVVRQGKRVVFQPRAVARDVLFAQKGKEFSRKVRTLTGNYQLLRLAPWLLSSRNPILFRFISHKLLRLLVPFLLIAMLLTSFAARTSFYRACFVGQCLFYLLAISGNLMPPVRRFRPAAVASTFVMLNVAAAIAFYNFVSRRNEVWV